MKKPFFILEVLIIIAFFGSFLLKEHTSFQIKNLLFTLVALGSSGVYMIFGCFFFGEINPKRIFDGNGPKLNPLLAIFSIICGITIAIIIVATWASLLNMPVGLPYSIAGSCMAGLVVLISIVLMVKGKIKNAILGDLRVLFFWGLLTWVYFMR